MRAPLCLLALALGSAAADFEPPTLTRLHPLGGRAGTTVEIEILGTHLDTAAGVEFDCADLEWKHTTSREKGRMTGLVAIAPDAPLDPDGQPAGARVALTRIARELSMAFLSDHFDSKRFRERPTLFVGREDEILKEMQR